MDLTPKATASLKDLLPKIAKHDTFVTTLFWVATSSVELDPYPIQICAFAGLYWVDPLEDDLTGYFETQDDAEDWAQDNWNHALYKEEDEAEAL